MSEQIRPAAEGNAAASLEEMPVALDFEIGSLAVPLGQLATLKPGYMFRLRGRADGVRVLIRANGVHVGHGELVALGDSLGVQLVAIEPLGADSPPRPEQAAFR